MSLETAVHKMSGFPAIRMNMKERGIIKTGMVADIVIFDSEKVIDNATWENPHQYPDGIPHVLVNGVPVVKNGTHTGATPGKVLRRGKS